MRTPWRGGACGKGLCRGSSKRTYQSYIGVGSRQWGPTGWGPMGGVPSKSGTGGALEVAPGCHIWRVDARRAQRPRAEEDGDVGEVGVETVGHVLQRLKVRHLELLQDFAANEGQDEYVECSCNCCYCCRFKCREQDMCCLMNCANKLICGLMPACLVQHDVADDSDNVPAVPLRCGLLRSHAAELLDLRVHRAECVPRLRALLAPRAAEAVPPKPRRPKPRQRSLSNLQRESAQSDRQG